MSDLSHDLLKTLAPGTGIRDGLERIRRGRTGALIVLGYDDEVAGLNSPQYLAANAAALGMADRLRAGTPDQVPADLRFDEIWSNPPIRIGKDALHELLLLWLPRLKPDGVAWLVVGKNLGADSLAKWLTAQGWLTEKLASAKGFRILKTTWARE